METRKLGTSDLELTTVGLGTWAIGGAGWAFAWGAQDDDEAVAAIVRGVELGVNWIDTAPVYGMGHSEELVGRALKDLGPSRRPLVATKCGRVWDDDGGIQGSLEPASVRAECEASLLRLGVETIDLYQMHWPDPDEQIEDAWATLGELQKEGKVRHIGVSNFNVEQLRRLQAIHPVASLQPPYNMIVRAVEDELLEFCATASIGIISYSPMCKGLLTGAFTRERVSSLGEDDHRARDPKFGDPQVGLHLELVEQLRPIAERAGRTLAQLAIAWVLRRREVTAAIVGARRPAQIEGTAPAADWVLTDSDLAEVDALLAKHAAAMRELGASTGRV
jgi:aryl-alcohol dehydrogenase-like predicted oxidoreductase